MRSTADVGGCERAPARPSEAPGAGRGRPSEPPGAVLQPSEGVARLAPWGGVAGSKGVAGLAPGAAAACAERRGAQWLVSFLIFVLLFARSN
jgi:hypothetical protein